MEEQYESSSTASTSSLSERYVFGNGIRIREQLRDILKGVHPSKLVSMFVTEDWTEYVWQR